MRRGWLVLALLCCASSLWTVWRWWPALESLLGSRARSVAAAEILAPLVCLGTALLARSARRPQAAALVRIVLAGLGLSWSGFLAVVPAYERLWFELSLGPLAGITALVLGFEVLSARLGAGRAKLARALLVALALGPPLTEAALRVLARVRPSQLFARDERSPGRILERNRLSHSTARFGTNCNTGGHYDEEFRRRAPGERRVALIGDSFSQGIVPLQLHYSTIAEQELGFPVDNLGIAGIGLPEYEELLVREALPLDPSAVIIGFFIGNDFELPQEESVRDQLLSSWLDRRSVLVWLLPHRLVRMAQERRENPTGIAGEMAEAAPGAGVKTLEERYPWIADPFLEKAMISKAGFLGIERARAKYVCLPNEEELLRSVPLLERMRRECEGRPFGVLLIPDEFQIEDGLWAELQEQEMVRDRPQALLKRELGKLGIPVLDLEPVMRAVPPLKDGNRHLYNLRDTHWNRRGNGVAGAALAGFVRELLALPTSGRR